MENLSIEEWVRSSSVLENRRVYSEQWTMTGCLSLLVEELLDLALIQIVLTTEDDSGVQPAKFLAIQKC